MSCPSCAAPLPDEGGAEPCPWCGAPAAAAVVLDGWRALPVVGPCTGLACPAGHGVLDVVRLAEVEVVGPRSLGRCPHCLGLFLGGEGVHHVLDGADPQSLVPPGSVGGKACPACAAPMGRCRLSGPTGGVIVELCPEHGLWLDPDELGWLLTPLPADAHPAAAAGPLERLRQVLAPLVRP